MEVKYMDLVKESWAMVKADLGFFIVGMLIVGCVGSCTGNILTPALTVGYIMAIMKKMNGEKVAAGDIFSLGMSKFLPAFITSIIMGIAISIGSVLLIVPGIIASYTAMLALYIIADAEDKDKIDFKEVIKQAFELFKANWKVLILGSIVAGFFGSLGTIACGIGAFVTMPIGWVMMTKIYQLIRDNGAAPAAAAAEAPAAEAPAAEAAAEA